MATIHERIIQRKNKELNFAKKRLESAIDDYNQFVFCPDFVGSEIELKLQIDNWNSHIKRLNDEILLYSTKQQQQSLNWGIE